MPVTVVKFNPPIPDPAPIVELGPGVGVAEATALEVDATRYVATVLARTSPMPVQNPARVLIVAYRLVSIVCAKLAHVATALSKAVGHHEFELT
jgi:hypothetical protein